MSDYKNIEDLGLDEITEDYLREMAIQMGTDLGVDTRQGSLYRDSAEGHIRRTADFFDDLRAVAEIIGIATCTGYVLDEKMLERGMQRNPPDATSARYYCIYNGAVPEVGDELTCSGHVFHVVTVERDDDDNLIVIIESEETGTEMNNLLEGTPVIPEIDVDGLISCTLGAIYDPAEDPEDDDLARVRLLNKIAGPDENANSAQIRSWCEAIEGVGSARVIPLWNGPMTVKVVIAGIDGRAPAASIVEAVQEYLDPGVSGMGEGAAPIGQFITVVAAEEITVDVSVSVVKSASATYEDIKSALVELLDDYISKLALEDYSAELRVRYNRISAIITDMEEVVDHENLLVNDGTDNLPFSIDQVPVLGEVTVDGNL